MEYKPLEIRKLQSGKWQGKMRYYDSEGKRREITKTAQAKLKRDARIELEQWEKEIRREGSKGVVTSNKQTVYQVVKSYLDYQLSIDEIEKSTYAKQSMHIESNVKDSIGTYQFTKVNKDVINNWVSQLYQRGLAPATIRVSFNVVRKTYNYNYFSGEIAENPFDHVKSIKNPKTRATYLDASQASDLLAALMDYEETTQRTWFPIAVRLAYHTGLRRGEICGLRWRDINLDKGILSVTTAIGKGNDGFYTKAPKTESSRREFPISADCRFCINIHRKNVGEPDNNWFVVGDKTKPLNPDTFSKAFKEFVRQYDLKDHYGNYLTLHSLRHNVATQGIQSQMDIASLSAMMGHSSRAMTLDVYGDASPDAMRIAVSKLAEYMAAISDETLGFDKGTLEQLLTLIQK